MENKENLIAKEQTTKENRIWVRISSACNNKCVFCLDENAQDGTLVPAELVKENIRNGFKPGYYNRIIISGGEASINPKFPDYIAYAKSMGYDRVQTVTNGNMFAIEKFCHKVFDAGLQEVTFSFHGHTPRLHDYLVDVPGAFMKSLKGIIFVKKYFPHIIVNIDIVVNKVNVDYLPDIVKFFLKLGVYEYDILHIIPFGRGFDKYKDILFYKVEDHLAALQNTWKLSKIPGMYMWTNRFPVQAFEGFEDLIQDPRKIKSEVMGEGYGMYSDFITSGGIKKPHCYGEACQHCFLNQYCHDFLNHNKQEISPEDVEIINGKTLQNLGASDKKYFALRGEFFPSEVYKNFGDSKQDFLNFIASIPLKNEQELLNVPKCIREHKNTGKYEYFPDIQADKTLDSYTQNYIGNFYRKKSTRCSGCIHNDSCEGIHLNFLRSYGFEILQPVQKDFISDISILQKDFLEILPEIYKEEYSDIIDISSYRSFFEYFSEIDSEKKLSYLELGCGVGLGMYILQKWGYRVEGLDNNTFKAFPKGNDSSFEILNHDFTKSLNNIGKYKTYNVIFLVNILHSFFSDLSNPEQYYVGVFENIYQKLSPGGRVVFNTCNTKGMLSPVFFEQLKNLGFLKLNISGYPDIEGNRFYVLERK